MFAGLNGRPLLFAPRPFSDELLLSWIWRLAAANHGGIDVLFPELSRLDPCRLNYDPGEPILHALALAARLHYSTLFNLLLPNQFANFAQLSFLQAPELSGRSTNVGQEVVSALTFCRDCAGYAEHLPANFYWHAEAGLPTTILCLQHGSLAMRACPICADPQLNLRWEQSLSVVRCSQCCWRPTPLAKNNNEPDNPHGPWELLLHLQRDIVTALRGQPPSNFWFGAMPATQFLTVLNDLYWLLRTPGLSFTADPLSTFSDVFFWTRPLSNSKPLFHRNGHLPFSAWHADSRVDLLLALATTMLGRRAFATLMHRPSYPPASAYYPFCWIVQSLKPSHALQLWSMSFSWPPTLRSRLDAAWSARGQRQAPSRRAASAKSS